MVQAFLKKWWVKSDFKAPTLPLSLRLKVSGCIYNNTWTKQVKQLSKQHQAQWSKCQTLLRHTLIKTNFWHFCWHLIFIHLRFNINLSNISAISWCSDVEIDMSIKKGHSKQQAGLTQYYWPMEIEHNQPRQMSKWQFIFIGQ